MWFCQTRRDVVFSDPSLGFHCFPLTRQVSSSSCRPSSPRLSSEHPAIALTLIPALHQTVEPAFRTSVLCTTSVKDSGWGIFLGLFFQEVISKPRLSCRVSCFKSKLPSSSFTPRPRHPWPPALWGPQRLHGHLAWIPSIPPVRRTIGPGANQTPGPQERGEHRPHVEWPGFV